MPYGPKAAKKEKTTLPKAPPYATEFSYVAIQYPRPGWGILPPHRAADFTPRAVAFTAIILKAANFTLKAVAFTVSLLLSQILPNTLCLAQHTPQLVRIGNPSKRYSVLAQILPNSLVSCPTHPSVLPDTRPR